MAQNLKCLCEQLPIRQESEGMEGVITGILPGLTDCLSGLLGDSYCALGLAEVREEIRQDDLYTVPQYYINNREWYNLEPTDTVPAFSFFYQAGPKENFDESFSIYNQDFNIIFWVNTEQLFTGTDESDYISPDSLQQTIINALSNNRFDAILSVNNIVEGYSDTWSDFDIVNDQTIRFNFKNYITFKVNLTLNIKGQICKC